MFYALTYMCCKTVRMTFTWMCDAIMTIVTMILWRVASLHSWHKFWRRWLQSHCVDWSFWRLWRLPSGGYGLVSINFMTNWYHMHMHYLSCIRVAFWMIVIMMFWWSLCSGCFLLYAESDIADVKTVHVFMTFYLTYYLSCT